MKRYPVLVIATIMHIVMTLATFAVTLIDNDSPPTTHDWCDSAFLIYGVISGFLSGVLAHCR